ncbi:iron-sulfur cluster biosynthesis family protein [Anoxybacteroides tepidamans]|uniref:iron-sulfur cluster biosynthesis family protein n=1 Tax=Anoxybacteroides tepidamans TaxID=265948 RepID=UPI0005513B2D|nr:iron-sulfur cluster biosynthesis family protein [Anoxybacillus tepidamans]
MNITFTEKAMQQLELILSQKNKQLKLKYDTDGCGCVVNGVPTLWLVDHADEDDVAVATNYIPILLEKSRLVFYDDTMTIDVVDGAGCFQLKSPNQILNPRMSLMEVSEQHE